MKTKFAEMSPAHIEAAKRGHSMIAYEKAKLRELEEQKRKDLLEYANIHNIGIVHIFNTNNPYGGCTVAFRKATDYKSGQMVDVAVANCANTDTFNRKIGTVNALFKFKNEETIQLPILTFYNKEDLNTAVKKAFTALYQEMLLY